MNSTASPELRSGTTTATRIISLAPSLTEIAFAIGCGDRVVADTTFDDYPAAAKALPHVADLKSVDLERVAALHPTAVLALRDQEREGSAIIARLGLALTYLPNRNIDDLYADIAGVASACQKTAAGAALSKDLKRRINAVAARAKRNASHPTVFVLLGLPGFTAGKRSYLNDLIALAGGVNAAGGIDQAYPNVNAEAIVRMDPDVVVVAKDTPFGADVRAREPWHSLRAVRAGRIVRPPDDSLLERRGPRIVSGLEWLSAALR